MKIKKRYIAIFLVAFLFVISFIFFLNFNFFDELGIDYDIDDISSHPEILDSLEGITKVDLSLVEFSNIGASKWLDFNLYAKGVIKSEEVDGFLNQFTEIDESLIKTIDFNTEIDTSIKSYNGGLRWWNPFKTEDSKFLIIQFKRGDTDMSDLLRLLITPLDSETSIIYLEYMSS